jgi:hypothetical protein
MLFGHDATPPPVYGRDGCIWLVLEEIELLGETSPHRLG